MPDTVESRLRVLERQAATMEQRQADMVDDLRAFAPLITAHAEMRIQIEHMRSETAQVRREIGELREFIEEDREERRSAQIEALNDSKQWRRALIIGSFTVLAAIVAAAATILAAAIS